MTARFALLRHEVPDGFARPSHWDLLLERGEACWTWSLVDLPAGLRSSATVATVDALKLADHRKHYLDYEGPLSGDRGSVLRVMGGACEWLEASENHVRAALFDEGIRREIVLDRLNENRWRLTSF